MEILTATAQDIDTIMILVRSCIERMRAEGIDQWDERYPDRATIERDVSDSTLFMATDQLTCHGIVVLNEHQDMEYETVDWSYREGEIAVVHRLMVKPNSRGQGIASHMMDFAETESASRGYSAIRLDAFSKNPLAMGLYTKRGYRRAGAVTFRKGVFWCFEKSLLRQLDGAEVSSG